MNVPRDQGLFFAVFFSVCFGMILTTWFLLPVYHKEAEETVENPGADLEKLATPEELIKKAENALLKAEAALSQLSGDEKRKPEGAKTKP
ncbi:MAG TPA: hypothetical protein VJK28_01955 [Nitrospiria bacterium]|nr:hypothetical protein [Nitrospiria bacterium]